jgi:putative YhdH/YhfP family quinone oxidoreductase
MNFKALIITENEDKSFSREVTTSSSKILKYNDTLVRVNYSSLNYKDALVAKGHKGIARNYPTIPGVDAVGEIIETTSSNFKAGDKVIVTGHDLGMNTPGGFSEYIKVPSDWLILRPEEISEIEAMIYGTAGITAGICIKEIINAGIKPDSGDVLVTGATGGVGTLAVAILAKLGYSVIASTGKKESHDFLKVIGANKIISREEVLNNSGRPLQKSQWIAAIDNVGGETLSGIISSTGYHGVVCSVGLVASDTFTSTVYPFLLRGIRIIGIDSAERGIEIKRELWDNFRSDWKPECLGEIHRIVKLDDIEPEIEKILKGGQIGKIIIDCR